jgi:hypothetical protein
LKYIPWDDQEYITVENNRYNKQQNIEILTIPERTTILNKILFMRNNSMSCELLYDVYHYNSS